MPGSTNQILEDQDLKNSLNMFFSKTNSFSQFIYLIITSLLCLLTIAMSIVNIPVFIHTRGIIRPTAEVSHILAPYEGIIEKINVIENQFVQKGHLLVQMESEKEKLQKSLLCNELSGIHQWLLDLRKITCNGKDSINLQTDKYRIDYQIYQQQLYDIDMRINIAKTDHERYINLLRENYISLKDFEESSLKYNSLRTQRNQLVSEKKSQWIYALNELKNRERILVKQISEIDFFIEKSGIRAPVSGIIQGIRNNYPGGYCSAGTNLCNLIPDTSLVAELFISPKDIGFISPGQKVRLLIDSYDYKYWGALKSTCYSISEDVELIQNKVLFRVICNLEPHSCLKYRNMKVFPGKGMTLTAQFLVAEKTVWQLLRDEAYTVIIKEPEIKNSP